MRPCCSALDFNSLKNSAIVAESSDDETLYAIGVPHPRSSLASKQYRAYPYAVTPVKHETVVQN